MARWLMVAALLPALTVAVEGIEAKSESRGDGRITFIVGESGEIGPSPRLIVMNADGSNRRGRLGWVAYASLSPNGRLIAYQGLGTRDTRVIAADGRLRDRLLVRNGNWAAWSPTGTAIAFVRGGDIWVKDLHSRTQRRVVRNAEPGEERCCAPTPDSSPDGKRLAFNRGTDVWVVDLASKRAHRLIRGARNARWSPDGHRIAFERDGTLRNYVFVARVDGTAERRVAEGESPAWSPDGRELAFTDGRRIIRLRLPGGQRRVVYDPGAFVACRFLDWAR